MSSRAALPFNGIALRSEFAKSELTLMSLCELKKIEVSQAYKTCFHIYFVILTISRFRKTRRNRFKTAFHTYLTI